MERTGLNWNRRDFLKVGGTSAAALGVTGAETAAAYSEQAAGGADRCAGRYALSPSSQSLPLIRPRSWPLPRRLDTKAWW